MLSPVPNLPRQWQYNYQSLATSPFCLSALPVFVTRTADAVLRPSSRLWLQRLRGPYLIDTSVTQYEAHIAWHGALARAH